MARAPSDDEDRALEAGLGAITDEDWLAGHQALIDMGVLPAKETRFLFDPNRAPASVTADDLTEDGQPRG